MVWSAFRASDDQQKYSYHIPDNIYLVGALQRLRVINAATWHDPYISTTAARLAEEVSYGIEQHGIVQLQVRAPESGLAASAPWACDSYNSTQWMVPMLCFVHVVCCTCIPWRNCWLLALVPTPILHPDGMHSYWQDGTRVYAYEVDGLGNSLVDFDDPNIPSLLAIPELGYYGYDKEVRLTSKPLAAM
jgi:hypothetical protein